MIRRDLLKGLAAAGVGAAVPIPGLTRLVFGATVPMNPVLIVLHLRGGCDGLNLVSPATDPDFIAARATELRVVADGKDAGFALPNGPDPRIDFRLHNAAGGLAELYQSRSLAVIHACGLTTKTRSHFAATDMIERGVVSDADLARVTTGWLTRTLGASGSLSGVGAMGALPGDLAEMGSAMSIPDLSGGLAPPGGVPIANALWQLYQAQDSEAAVAGRTALQMMAAVDVKMPRDAQGRIVPYQPETGVTYDPAADFARPLKTAAQLIKMELGLQAVVMEYGNWDTHEYQPGRFRSQVERLSNGLAAFWNDMAAYHDRLAIVALTEFGRRFRGNKSTGTDHGRAGVALVLGGRVQGGRIFGTWPGLKTEQLEDGVDLAVTTDYRRVLTEAVSAHLHLPGAAGFPGYAYPGKLGVFG